MLDEDIQFMANFFIIDLKFFLFRVRFPLRNPLWKFISFYLGELENVGKTDSTPNAVSADLTFFSLLQLVDLS